jgi:HSP90 family molecular chaperone
MKFDAKYLRVQRKKQLKQQLNEIVNKHYNFITSAIEINKRDQEYIYTLDFLPGYKEYNYNIKGKVCRTLVAKLKKEKYQVTCIEPNKIKIEWYTTDRKALEEYINCLMNTIYNNIKESIKQDENKIEFIIPVNIIYPPDKVLPYLQQFLQQRNFKVYVCQYKLLIEW